MSAVLNIVYGYLRICIAQTFSLLCFIVMSVMLWSVILTNCSKAICFFRIQIDALEFLKGENGLQFKLCVCVMNDSAHTNGASVYHESPQCIVVIKLLMHSLMWLQLTKRMVIVNNAVTNPAPSSMTCTEGRKKTTDIQSWRCGSNFFFFLWL